MSETTNIEWCDSTFNPWIGCTKVSTAPSGGGCDGCYAAESTPVRVMRGKGHETWGPGAARHRTSNAYWKLPLRWDAQAAVFEAQHGRRRRVFCASLADVFDNEVDPAWRRDLFNLILSTPGLDWLLLTKRIGNAARMIDETLSDSIKALPADSPLAWPWPNVWLGATVVNQAEADRDIPKLLDTPAAVRFLSVEPMLGSIDLTRYHDWLGRSVGGMWCPDCPDHGVGIDPEEHRGCFGEVVDASPYDGVDWVIAGGESGPSARPADPDWFRALRDQCAAAGVPFLFKQWGEHAPARTSGPPLISDINGIGDHLVRCGKKAAGRLLDGVEHNAFPKAHA